jgi:membrane-anchored glycerophosphoryl diester phosphodiesterase (GDPDase)
MSFFPVCILYGFFSQLLNVTQKRSVQEKNNMALLKSKLVSFMMLACFMFFCAIKVSRKNSSKNPLFIGGTHCL